MRYPNLNICELHSKKLSNDLFSIDVLEDYVPQNPQVQKTHSHDFFHLALITAGTGSHVIDFKSFDVVPGTLYFMRPFQVHQWKFGTDVKGFVINVSATFFDANGIHSGVLEQFPFFKRATEPQVFILPQDLSAEIITTLQQLLKEQYDSQSFKNLFIATSLLKLMLQMARTLYPQTVTSATGDSNFDNFVQFQDLVERDFTMKRLPKEYAAALHITPAQLNKICQQWTGVSSGDFIRERLLLEAKRLLVNESKSISEIAYVLNFSDNSYFTKFFKKYTQLTPEQFRAQL